MIAELKKGIARLARGLADRAIATGDSGRAGLWYRRALMWQPGCVVARIGLAETLQGEGLAGDAGKVLDSLPPLADGDVDVECLYRLGCLRMDLGEPELAKGLFEQVVALEPGHSKAWNNLGCICTALGTPHVAADCYRRALQAAPGLEQAALNLAAYLLQEGAGDEAVRVLQSAVQANETSHPLRVALADILGGKGQYEDAIANYLVALALRPADIQSMVRLGQFMLKVHNFSGAKSVFLEVLSLEEDSLDGVLGLLACRQQLGEWGLLGEEYPVLLEKYPDNAGLISDYGVYLENLDRIPEAFECYDRATRLNPGFPNFRFHRGLALLAMGRYRDGFSDYEARLEMAQLQSFQDIPGPVWDGARLRDERLLVVGEQGFGDLIQFARYIPMIARQGGVPHFALGAPMQRLLASVPGVASVISLEDARKWDGLKVPLLSLPHIFATTESTVPAEIPYLEPNAEVKERWANKLRVSDATLQVGIVWQSGGHNPISRFKSIPLDCLFGLAEIPRIRFVCLQPEVDEAARQFMHRAGWLNISSDLTDFMETAGAVDALDLVISVDTAVAHLAGALGVPVWTLLAHAPDWRWRLDEVKTPWYPTMQLFRQTASGDWAGVMRRVSRQLADTVKY